MFRLHHSWVTQTKQNACKLHAFLKMLYLKAQFVFLCLLPHSEASSSLPFASIGWLTLRSFKITSLMSDSERAEKDNGCKVKDSGRSSRELTYLEWGFWLPQPPTNSKEPGTTWREGLLYSLLSVCLSLKLLQRLGVSLGPGIGLSQSNALNFYRLRLSPFFFYNRTEVLFFGPKEP